MDFFPLNLIVLMCVSLNTWPLLLRFAVSPFELFLLYRVSPIPVSSFIWLLLLQARLLSGHCYSGLAFCLVAPFSSRLFRSMLLRATSLIIFLVLKIKNYVLVPEFLFFPYSNIGLSDRLDVRRQVYFHYKFSDQRNLFSNGVELLRHVL